MGHRLLVGGLLGWLWALQAQRPCDPRNDELDSEKSPKNHPEIQNKLSLSSSSSLVFCSPLMTLIEYWIQVLSPCGKSSGNRDNYQMQINPKKGVINPPKQSLRTCSNICTKYSLEQFNELFYLGGFWQCVVSGTPLP